MNNGRMCEIAVTTNQKRPVDTVETLQTAIDSHARGLMQWYTMRCDTSISGDRVSSRQIDGSNIFEIESAALAHVAMRLSTCRIRYPIDTILPPRLSSVSHLDQW